MSTFQTGSTKLASAVSSMIDFPITELLSESECLAWLTTFLHPEGLVLLLRGIAKGESSARLSRELGIGRKLVMVQNNLYETLPTQVMASRTFEADELYQNARKKRHAAS